MNIIQLANFKMGMKIFVLSSIFASLLGIGILITSPLTNVTTILIIAFSLLSPCVSIPYYLHWRKRFKQSLINAGLKYNDI